MSGVKGIAEALDRLLKNVSYDPESGTFRAEDNRLMILYTDTFVSVQKGIESLIGFDTAGMLLYEAYKEAGRISGRLYLKNAKSPIKSGDTIKLALDFTRALAWGRWEASVFDKTKALFTVRDSPIAESYGKSDRAVCHQIRGLIAGFAEYFTGQRRESVEVMCKAKGEDHCEFLVAPPESITKLTLERLEENDSRKH
jgi:hypothetical protein